MTGRTRHRLHRGGPVVLLLALAGCTAVSLPRLDSPPETRRTVVVVPGITGVELVDPSSGKVVWGRGVDLLWPHDGGYRLGPEDLVPGRAIRRIRLGPIVKPIYRPIERLFTENGWSSGDLAQPSPGADFFLFSYDWRQSNSRSAIELGRQLGVLAASRGGESAVTLICQSNGAHVCRYLVKYGTAPMDEAEHGRSRAVPGVRIDQIVLVGTANGGSLRLLQFLNRGRRYVPLVGRRFQPELFFTFESLYQDLPAYREDLFVDPSGESLDVDLFAAETWSRYGWSVHAPAASRRLARPRARALGPPAQAPGAFLAQALERARRFRDLLDGDVAVAPVRYYSIQNDRALTPARAVLRPTPDGWETLLPGDPEIDGSLAARLVAPGDGHATVSSQRWLSAAELDAFEEATFHVDGGHFEMILQPEALDRLLAICASPPHASRKAGRGARRASRGVPAR